MKKKVSEAGKRAQAEYDAALAAGKTSFCEYMVDEAHRDAREREWKAAEKARIAAKKQAQAEAKAKREAERAAVTFECQICGGYYMATKGLLAHHGYRRPGTGWQTASCMGARFVEYAVSRDRIGVAIESVTEHIGRVRTRLSLLAVQGDASLTWNRKKDCWDKVGELVTVPRPEGWTPQNQEKETYRWDPKVRTYSELYQAQVKRLAADLKSSEETLVYLNGRWNGWPGLAK